MHRIDSATRKVDLFGAGKDGYTEGNPVEQEPATRTTAAGFNAFQEEPCAVIEDVGIELDKDDNHQLLAALNRRDVRMQLRNWFRVPVDSTADLKGVVFFPPLTRWVAVGGEAGDAVALWSAPYDPEEWDVFPDLPAGGTLHAVAVAGNVLVAVGAGGVIRRYEAGGPGWSSPASGVAVDLHAVAYNEEQERWCAVGAGGTVLTSADGSAWTAQVSGTAATLRGLVATAAGLWCAVGDGGVIVGSPVEDGWTVRDSGTASDLAAVAVESGSLVAVGPLVARASPDGENWAAIPGGRPAGGIAIGVTSDAVVVLGGANKLQFTWGMVWEVGTPPHGAALRALADGGAVRRVWVAVGDAGAVVRSLVR